MLTKVFFLFVVFAAANAQTDISRCIVNSGELPDFVEVVGCTSTPCLLPQLEYAEINMRFRAPYTMVSMRTLATYYLHVGPTLVPVPYDLAENSFTCNFLTGANCPVLQGEVLSYRLRIFMESFLPVGTQATLEIRIVNVLNSNSFVCIRFPFRVEPPLPATFDGPENIIN
ncbi:uncharacterized protein LOC113225400 [Hyposmocoma kahamanoa]|uniref:uncharacterized protein LOC113225400 n=1 Tax=Hyposmocoma kahamanoa TaxID=1477025 RepID=UPI000E6D6709|nr:uncharacterized protein LOC113225400 [Hyposmocoma kahamanoa]